MFVVDFEPGLHGPFADREAADAWALAQAQTDEGTTVWTVVPVSPVPEATRKPTGPYRPRALIDFDGVVHAYSRGWSDGEAYDHPVPGAKEGLADLLSWGFEIVIFSTRDADQITRWLRDWGFPEFRVTNTKEPAQFMLDDRAIRFTGDWTQALRDVNRWYRP